MLRSLQQPIDKHRSLMKVTDKCMYKINMSMLMLKHEERKPNLGDKKLKTAMRVSVLSSVREIMLCMRESILMTKTYRMTAEQINEHNSQLHVVRSAISPMLSAARQSANNVMNRFETHVSDITFKMIAFLQLQHSVIRTGIRL
jgi:2-hydroxy-3-keto-5-methylthiopentenyl-1-phosphate phosphatase